MYIKEVKNKKIWKNSENKKKIIKKAQNNLTYFQYNEITTNEII